MIDARGYSCPMPVVMVQNEVKKNAPASLDVLVDSMPAWKTSPALPKSRVIKWSMPPKARTSG